jgi:hypothetical protein
MRTKTLLCAAALAAGVVSSMAQSNVYSLNVVGYVNVPTKGGGNFNLIANPLNNANNNISNLFAGFAQDGDQVYRWNAGIQDVDATVPTYSGPSATWTPNMVLKPGEGVFYLNAGVDRTNTFVGEVIQGSYTNPIALGTTVAVRGGGSFNSFGSSIPLGGSFTNAIVGITPRDGDQVYFWNVAAQDIDPTVPTYSGPSATWTPSTTVLNPGSGFLYLGAGVDQAQWVRSFTVQ